MSTSYQELAEYLTQKIERAERYCPSVPASKRAKTRAIRHLISAARSIAKAERAEHEMVRAQVAIL